jgi:hypothetical protein
MTVSDDYFFGDTHLGLAGSIIYNDNDLSGGRVAAMVRMSIAGTVPVAGLLHSGLLAPLVATSPQPNQAPGTINYSAGGIASQGPGSAAPATPVGNLPVSAASSGNSNIGAVAQSAIGAMSNGTNTSTVQPYLAAPALGSDIPSNAATAVGAQQSLQNTNGMQLINNVAFGSAPSGTIAAGGSVGTLTVAFTGQTASNYVLTLSTGQVLFGITLTSGATTCTTATGVTITGTPSVNAQLSQ